MLEMDGQFVQCYQSFWLPGFWVPVGGGYTPVGKDKPWTNYLENVITSIGSIVSVIEIYMYIYVYIYIYEVL